MSRAGPLRRDPLQPVPLMAWVCRFLDTPMCCDTWFVRFERVLDVLYSSFSVRTIQKSSDTDSDTTDSVINCLSVMLIQLSLPRNQMLIVAVTCIGPIRWCLRKFQESPRLK